MKREIKKLLKDIDEDRKQGRIISLHNCGVRDSLWLKLFGTGGCSHYPYLSDKDKIQDLKDYLEGGTNNV
jgi:hypothetical protein